MKILFLSDVNGKPGRIAVAEALPAWKKKYRPDVVIANAENSANGRGAVPKTLDALHAAGVDAFTMGDHSFDQAFEPLEKYPIVRPGNFAPDQPGVGDRVIETPAGRLLLINLLGFAFLRHRGTNYFRASDQILKKYAKENLDAILVDFHAEATSEKTAMGYHLDGRVSAVVGTHTHVPTADTHLLPQGTAFQSDVGMCGAAESVIGISLAGSKAFLLREMGERQQAPPKGGADNRPYTCDAVLIETAGPTGAKSIARLTNRT